MEKNTGKQLNIQNTKDLESKTSQSISASSISNVSQNASSTSTDELAGDNISNSFKRECKIFGDRLKSGDSQKANESRHLLRTWRDNILERVSKWEDRDDVRAEHLRDQLIKSDGYLRAVGLDAVIDDSDYPTALDSSLDPGFQGSDDLGGDC